MADTPKAEENASGSTIPIGSIGQSEPPISQTVPSPPPDDTSLVDSLINQSQPPQPMQTGAVKSGATQPPLGGSAKKKKNSSFGIMLAGVLILMITLPIGIYFVSQQNTRLTEQRSCAAGDDLCVGTPGPYADVTAPPGVCDNASCCHQYKNKTCWWNLPSHPDECWCTGDSCADNDWSVWGACHIDTCKCIQVRYCNGGDNTYQIRECSDASCTPCGETPTKPVTPGQSPTNTPKPTATPTPLPGQCSSIRIYKGGVSIDPNTLAVGDVVQIACAGTNATKARIRVNGGGWGETSVKNNNGEYFISYTITSGVTSFTVESEIFTNNEWK